MNVVGEILSHNVTLMNFQENRLQIIDGENITLYTKTNATLSSRTDYNRQFVPVFLLQVRRCCHSPLLSPVDFGIYVFVACPEYFV